MRDTYALPRKRKQETQRSPVSSTQTCGSGKTTTMTTTTTIKMTSLSALMYALKNAPSLALPPCKSYTCSIYSRMIEMARRNHKDNNMVVICDIVRAMSASCIKTSTTTLATSSLSISSSVQIPVSQLVRSVLQDAASNGWEVTDAKRCAARECESALGECLLSPCVRGCYAKVKRWYCVLKVAVSAEVPIAPLLRVAI